MAVDLKKQYDLVVEYISQITPYIKRDGGDLSITKIEDGIVYIKMFGACIECKSLDITLKDGIEAMLIENVEGIIGVTLDNEDITTDQYLDSLFDEAENKTNKK
jgi:Fe-S cluster biogenesis protein NfuA